MERMTPCHFREVSEVGNEGNTLLWDRVWGLDPIRLKENDRKSLKDWRPIIIWGGENHTQPDPRRSFQQYSCGKSVLFELKICLDYRRRGSSGECLKWKDDECAMHRKSVNELLRSAAIAEQVHKGMVFA